MGFNFLSLLVIIILTNSSAHTCELNKPIVSLSGPLTMLLEELDLLKDKNLKGISVFHPIEKKTSAEVFAGGLFLSKRVLKRLGNIDYYFDESRELNNFFKNAQVKSHPISTVNNDSFSITFDLISMLMNITSGCKARVQQLKKNISLIEKKLTQDWRHPKLIFFLGKITNRLPEMIMVNDGPMEYLVQKKLVKTYPSTLSYIQWSQKILNNLKGFKLIGLSDIKQGELLVKKLKTNQWNLSYRGVLIPGIRQIYFLKELNKTELD